MERTDAVIVGAGPAGSAVASFLAREGFEVILLEKRPDIGIPVRCGEATGSRAEISRFIPIDEAWITADINAVRLVSPGGRIIEKQLPGVGVVLDRARFDKALSDQARAHGADVRVNAEAIGLLHRDDCVCGVRVHDLAADASYDIRSRVTIGADGVEGSIGRWTNLTHHLSLSEIHSAIQYLIEADEVPRDTIELYAGSKIAPGGYAWVFPKQRGFANVGLGIDSSTAPEDTAKAYLDRFLEKHYPEAKIHATVAGGTSGTKPLKTMVEDGVLLVGEAAHQNNPLSGGGIMNALEGAEEAAAVLVGALRADDLSSRFLKRYDKRWEKRVGRSIAKYALLRKLLFRLEDRELDSVAGVLEGLSRNTYGERPEYAEIFKAAIKTAPGVIWKARTLLW